MEGQSTDAFYGEDRESCVSIFLRFHMWRCVYTWYTVKKECGEEEENARGERARREAKAPHVQEDLRTTRNWITRRKEKLKHSTYLSLIWLSISNLSRQLTSTRVYFSRHTETHTTGSTRSSLCLWVLSSSKQRHRKLHEQRKKDRKQPTACIANKEPGRKERDEKEEVRKKEGRKERRKKEWIRGGARSVCTPRGNVEGENNRRRRAKVR